MIGDSTAIEPTVEDVSGEWIPENPRQHPPFEPGNELATLHGAYSPKHVDPVARELVDLVLADPATAYLVAGHWRPALWAWARAEAQVSLLDAYLARKGQETEDGIGDLGDERVKAAYLIRHRALNLAQSGRTRLGLDPLSAARLGRDRTAATLDAARLMAEMARQEREEQGS